MAGDSSDHGAPTRREYVKYGGAVVGGGLLAGCAGQGDGGSTPTETETDESTATESSTPEDQSYSVTMSPMGTVEFEEVPESAVAFDDQWIDHMVALGQADKVAGLARPDGYFTEYYKQLPGVSLDTDSIEKIWGGDSIDKEVLYSVDADVHHIDPIRSTQNLGFDEADVEEVRERIGPYFANRYSRSHNAPESVDEYQYYTLWELAEKFAQVYQVPGRVEQLKQIRDEMVADIESNLPPEDERPTVGLVAFWDKNEKWYPYKINQEGFGRSHYQHLGVDDAFDDSDKTYNASYDAAYDHEGMLDIDPDILIQHFGITYPDSGESSMEQSVYEPVRNDPVASELTAVKNGRFYAGGTAFQGPLYNLFQIEIAAKQIYPDRFGEFRGVGNTPESEQMFDRQRVADIVNGEI
ncbi:ABC transporter substrate-binding protein [Natronomonas sp. EA1]|uniref:ABC transporter substrate-binding protein n=1 Tax=Natronomonas sp. EA1 TaxID=3421655 RepID=UPI003EC053B8